MARNVCDITIAVLLVSSCRTLEIAARNKPKEKQWCKFKRPLLLKVHCYSVILLYFLNRNQSEVSNRGGIKALCGLLKTAANEKVSCAQHLRDKCDNLSRIHGFLWTWWLPDNRIIRHSFFRGRLPIQGSKCWSTIRIMQVSFNCLKICLVKLLPPCLALEQIAGLRRL